MQFKKIEQADIIFFKSVLEEKYVLLDDENLSRCAGDQTEDLHFLPEVVLQPRTPGEISSILKYCNEQTISVTPRGAGTGLSGGALPVRGGVVLDMKRFNKILNIDRRNFQVTTESGVITQELQEQLKAEGLFYPPDPARVPVLLEAIYRKIPVAREL